MDKDIQKIIDRFYEEANTKVSKVKSRSIKSKIYTNFNYGGEDINAKT